jgi:hypothetical protein
VQPAWDNATIAAILDALRRYLNDPAMAGPAPVATTGAKAPTATPQARRILEGHVPDSGSRPASWKRSAGSAVPDTQHSEPLRTLGAGEHYTVSWVVGSDPAGSAWLVGLSGRENEMWSDVEFGLECDNGVLGAWRHGEKFAHGGRLSAGDRLSLKVSGTTLEYQKNGVTFATARIAGARDYRVDASVRAGAAGLGGIALSLP